MSDAVTLDVNASNSRPSNSQKAPAQTLASGLFGQRSAPVQPTGVLFDWMADRASKAA